MNITSSIESIGPEEAAAHLARNTRNRHINRRTVAKYAHDIEAGQWQMAGEPIKFAEDGTLLDGQHRLEAIIKTGASLPMLVVRGLAPESQHVMDSGKPRGLAGQLQIAGHPNAVRLASTARLAYWYEEGLLFSDNRVREQVSKTDYLTFVDENPDLSEAVLLLPNNYRQKVEASPQVICTFIWLTRRIDTEASERFMYQLTSKTNLPNGSPIIALDSRFREMARTRTTISGQAALSVFIRAWNAWRQDKPLGRIQTHRDGFVIQFKEVL